MPATVAYTYLGLNTPVRADYEDPDVRWDLITGSGVNPYAGLDRFGRTIDCRWEKYSSTAADLARLKYGYNRASSRQWRDDTVGTGFDEFYTYDAVQRLIDMERGTLTGGPPPTGITSATLGQEWTLDPTGNWSGFEQTLAGAVTQTRTSNMDNEITNITNSVGSAWAKPVYNNAGAMTFMPSAGAAPTPARSGIYDAWDRMTRTVGGVLGTADYRYDGLNRRTTKVTLSPSETRHFYYSDQWQVLEERVGSSTDAERQHVWGLRYVDDLALRDRDTNGDGSLDERLYSMQDDNWNVVAICNPSAVVQERYAYTPYGMIQFLNASFGAISASAFAWRYLFTGRERDTESSLQYNRNRYYHARLGVWTTRDPMGYQAGDVNLYRYLRGTALRGVDPNGLQLLLPDHRYKYIFGRLTIPNFRAPFRQTGQDQQFPYSSSVSWNIGAVGPWFVGTDGCLRCNEIGVVQIAKSEVEASGLLQWGVEYIRNNNYSWRIDAPGQSDGVYPNGRERVRPRITSWIHFRDSPGLPGSVLEGLGYQVVYIRQEFEMWVACLAGTERGAVYFGASWGHVFVGKNAVQRWATELSQVSDTFRTLTQDIPAFREQLRTGPR